MEYGNPTSILGSLSSPIFPPLCWICQECHWLTKFCRFQVHNSTDFISTLCCILCLPPQVRPPSITVYPPLPSSTSLHCPLPEQSPHCCLCPWVIFLLFFFIAQSPHPWPLITVSLLSIHESVIILFLSSFYSLNSYISEIIWWLSFCDWIISPSVISPGPSMLSQRVRFPSFSWPSSIILCKCTRAFLSTHLLMDTWAASKSWLL